MDLSILRQSLHRLALLEENNGTSGQQNAAGGTIRLPDDGSPQQPQPQPQPQLQQAGGKGDDNLKAPRGRPRADPIGSLLRAGRRGGGGGGGGGIRVYEDEEDEWDLSSSESGKWESSGYQKRISQRSPLMRLRVSMNGVSALFFVSMGSNVNVLKPEIAKRARLSITKMEPAAWVSLDTGSGHGPGMPVDYQAASAPYQIDDFFAQDDFYITPELTTRYVDGIVGIDWLEKYKPTVNYRLNRIELIDMRGRVHIIESVPGSERAGRGENETQWISARMWDWDMKTILRGHYLTEYDVPGTA